MQKTAKKSSDKKGQSAVVKGYLFLYNAIQVVGWSYLFYLLLVHFISGKSSGSLWEEVKWTVLIFQNAAILEIVNVALGFVKSNLAITTTQVFSRVMVVCGLMAAAPPVALSIGLPMCLFAWSVTEIIRYSMYALTLVGSVPYFLTWCRYTFFYLLYPLGVSGELLCYYAAQKYVSETKMWTLEMPNTINFGFSYQYLLFIIMLTYIPGFPQLYFYMISQRKKIIGSSEKKSK